MKTDSAQRDPIDLKRHPLHKAKVPEPDKESPEWAAFIESVRADGRIRETVKITRDNLVMDGWWRVLAARDLQFEAIPCEICDAAEAALLIVESLTARKQMTRGATVYLALGLLEEYAEAAEKRRLRNLAAERTTGEEKIDLSSTRQEHSSRYLAQRWGVHHETICKAREVRAFLHDGKTLARWLKDHDVEVDSVEATQATLRAEFEPMLFNGDKSLWKVLQAAGGRLSTKDLPKGGEQLELFGNRFSDFITTAVQLPDVKSARPKIEEALENFDDVERLQRISEIAGEIIRQAAARTKTIKEGELTR